MDNFLITKKIIYPGEEFRQLKNGCKVHFHFQTRKTDSANTLIDDSRVIGKKQPMVLVLGKKFKLEAWEAMVQKMAVGEVAKFTVDKSLVIQYPFVSKTLRDLNKDPSERKTHFCSMTLQNEGIGYKDLNELISKPCDLEFIIELLKVEFPDEYEKDAWQLSDDEKFKKIPLLKEKGNEFYKNQNYSEAAEMYYDAIAFLEQLMIKEKPHDKDWDELNKMKLPLLLNFSQCKLFEGDYSAVIQHCSTVLSFEPKNIKALFRRGKAHVASWNPNEALNDFKKVKELDPSLSQAVDKELKVLDGIRKERDVYDKEKFKNMFT